MTRLILVALLCVLPLPAGPIAKKKSKVPEPSLLEQYIRSASSLAEAEPEASPGAIWTPGARLTDLGRDLRASMVDDVVTVIVTETVNAVATGVSTSQRSSSANASVSSLAGKKSTVGALANLAGLSGDQKLNGTGTTSRGATLNATLTARVVKVLPGGLLLIEGDKSLQVNSEQQVITVRGIVRTADISTSNTVPSTHVADLEVRVNGKGLVADAVRRPNILYRLLLGVLPF
jgi:flagellar L-ring protein precursor FlgH